MRAALHELASRLLFADGDDYRASFGSHDVAELVRLGSRLGLGPRSYELIDYAREIGRVPVEIPELARELGLSETDGATLLDAARTLGLQDPRRLHVFREDLAALFRGDAAPDVDRWADDLRERLIDDGLPNDGDDATFVDRIARVADEHGLRADEFTDFDQFLQGRGSSLEHWPGWESQQHRDVAQWRAARLGIQPARFMQLS